ncbi:hypothetical protein DAA51_26605 [Bradyrhizobium sp. WBAH10]|nr:hypothetical protein [Bradyrhizobium sp. WBAH30]MDD1543351.1 hypothetical protein [Bradyrhizobium sp. WBAH41]MDD1554728.1 hypothetical protein [Bradyrhizobium sp. WBAH23]MDD1562679.1 hypothetical protein [Bradyrhizobium sp. WBAH33]MDD1588973.1 hypothetical protein [Bradyrhizobium sp. WBAH42]NRB85738.1 hypothetical protein [Bradyrhizobium sp. WBAH10]QCJ91698.1 hypothetical protein DAA57_26855 [Bradyrhizobium yuanmingense]
MRRSNPGSSSGGSLDRFAALAMTEYAALPVFSSSQLNLQARVDDLPAAFARGLTLRARDPRYAIMVRSKFRPR